MCIFYASYLKKFKCLKIHIVSGRVIYCYENLVASVVSIIYAKHVSLYWDGWGILCRSYLLLQFLQGGAGFR